MAEIASELGLFDAAAEHLTRAQQLEPANEMYPTLLRLLAKKQKRAHTAELESRLASGEPNAAAYDELGDAYRELDQLGDAMTAYQRAIQLEPQRDVTRAKLAYAFASRNLFEDADETLQQVELRPQMSPSDLQVLKDLFYRCAERMEAGSEPAAALRAFRSVLRIEAGYKDVVERVERLRQRADKKA
jgi:tetratricopeptide (TPR) repeat protein